MDNNKTTQNQDNPLTGNSQEDYSKEQLLQKRSRERRGMTTRLTFATISVLLFTAAAFLILWSIARSGSELKIGPVNFTRLFDTEGPSIDNGLNALQAASSQAVSGQGSVEDAVPEQVPASSAENSPEEKEPDQPAVTEKQPSGSDDSSSPEGTAAPGEAAPVFELEDASIMEQAELLAAGYDYDAAIALLKSIPDYGKYNQVTKTIASWQDLREFLVPVDVTTVPHIFYHSLLNDTDRAFNVSVLGQFAVDGMNAWMTTVDEFDRITQALYDNGYVYVSLHDLVTETVHDDGSVTFAPNTELKLPSGKKAIVLSVDDLSYYHSYEPAGFPDKLVLDDEGLVKCQYTTADGEVLIGDFDVVPRLNTFLREHPDGAYHGARGMIAMTGYNGVFGYRTDSDYEYREHLMEDQAAWLEKHPDFNRQEEIEQAKVIADAIKAEGWEFASHTWGHLSVTQVSAEKLKEDNEKWVANVQNIVGPTDTIIFAHGNDIGDWTGYSEDNEQYRYYSSAGYRFFCNVDGSVPYWVQITDHYVRQGRIDLDGYMLYQSSRGETTVLDNLFLASQVFDSRRPTPVVAEGHS